MTDVPSPAAPETPPPAAPRRVSGRRRRVAWRWTRRLMLVATAAIAGLLVTFLSIDLGRFPVIKREAEKAATNFLKRPMHIGEIRATLTPGRFIFKDVVIEGTPDSRPFFQAKTIVVEVPWRNLLTFNQSRDLLVTADILDWKMAVEKWPDHTNVPPNLKSQSKGGKKRFTTTARVYAKRGEFYFEDHGARWSVVAPNLNFSLARAAYLEKYVGNIAFDGGTVKIQDALPLPTALSARFILDGSLVHLQHIDLITDGSESHVGGEVNFSRWPEQVYTVNSDIDFKRMREIFFARENWQVDGKGHFTGEFRVFKDMPEAFKLAGDFSSETAVVNDVAFPNLHGSLEWRPSSFRIPHAEADFFGGQTRFVYAIEPLGAPGGATQRFTADLKDVDARAATRFFNWRGIDIAGRAGGHVSLAWPSGRMKTDRIGDAEITIEPPAGISIARANLPSSVVMPAPDVPIDSATGKPVIDQATGKPAAFDPYKSAGVLPIGGIIHGHFDAEGLRFDESWVATPSTYVSFDGRANSQDANLPFHVTSLDWQASSRLLSAIMTAITGPSKAVPVNGYGVFDGVMTGSFTAPRIAGHFEGQQIRAWNVEWGRTVGDIVIHDRYVDITNGVIGDPSVRSIRVPNGKFSIETPRKTEGDEMDAHIELANWPLADLKTAFELGDWPITGTIASATLQLRGPYKSPVGNGEMRLTGSTAWDERLGDVRSLLEFDGRGGVNLNSMQIAKSTGSIRGGASINWKESTYAFSVKGSKIPVESLDNFRLENTPLTGLFSFDAFGNATFDKPEYTVTGHIGERIDPESSSVLGPLYIAGQGIGYVLGELTVRENVMNFTRLDISSPLLQVSGQGRIQQNEAHDAELTFTVVNSSIGDYLQFLENAPRFTPYLSAIVSGSLRIVGELSNRSHLGADVQIDAAEFTAFDYKLVNDGPIVFNMENDALTIGQFKLKDQDTPVGREPTALELIGRVSLADKTMDLTAKGHADLKILQGIDFRPSGSADLNARAFGSFADPIMSGYANIKDGFIYHTAMPNSLNSINGQVTFDERFIKFDGLKAKFAGGDVGFTGSIALENFALGDFNVDASGRSMSVLLPEGFRSTVNAALNLRGTVDDLILGGEVTVISVTSLPSVNPEVGLLALATSRGGGGAQGGEAPRPVLTETGFPLSYNIQINAPFRSVVYENRAVGANLAARGNLHLTGTYDRPVLDGRVDIDTGSVNFNGNRINVLDGSVQFLRYSWADPNSPPPTFSVHAETRARTSTQTFEVNLAISGTYSGTSSRLNLNATANPYLSEIDIATLLLGGEPDVGTVEERALQSTQKAQAYVLQNAAAQILTSPISTQVGNVAGRIPGASVALPITLNPNSSQLNPTAKLVYGQRLSARLSLTYTRTLTGAQNDLVLIEYEQSDRLSWILSRNEDRSFALDFRVRRVY